MIRAVFLNLAEGILRPRASMRRLLDAGHGYDVALQMMLLAYLLLAIFSILLPGMRGPDEATGLVWHVQGLLLQAAVYLATVGMVYGVGRLFHGQGRWIDAHLGVAWYALVTAFLEPLTVPARIELNQVAEALARGEEPVAQLSGNAVMLFVFAAGLMLWLLASYVAELHRFASTLKVLAVIVCLSMMLSALWLTLVPPA